jgi:hypothetical protein
VLSFERIYRPFFGEEVSPEHATALKQVVDDAWRKGFRIKVALIATRNDLGGLFQLWGKPQTYADFLGRELVFLYKHTLITVMPSGLGVYVYKNKSLAEKEKTLIGHVRVRAGADGIADTASIAVAKLAGLPSPNLPTHNDRLGGSGGLPWWQMVLIGVGGIITLAAMLLVGPMWWKRGRAPQKSHLAARD